MTDADFKAMREAFPAEAWIWPRYKDVCGVDRNSPYAFSHQQGWSLTVSADSYGGWVGNLSQRSTGGGCITKRCETLEECLVELRKCVLAEMDALYLILHPEARSGKADV